MTSSPTDPKHPGCIDGCCHWATFSLTEGSQGLNIPYCPYYPTLPKLQNSWDLCQFIAPRWDIKRNLMLPTAIFTYLKQSSTACRIWTKSRICERGYLGIDRQSEWCFKDWWVYEGTTSIFRLVTSQKLRHVRSSKTWCWKCRQGTSIPISELESGVIVYYSWCCWWYIKLQSFHRPFRWLAELNLPPSIVLQKISEKKRYSGKVLFQENGTLKGLLQPHGSFLWPRFFKPTDSESNFELCIQGIHPSSQSESTKPGFPLLSIIFPSKFLCHRRKGSGGPWRETRNNTEDLRLTEKVYHKIVDVLCLLYFLLQGIFHSHVPCSFIRLIASILTSRSIIMWPSLPSVAIVVIIVRIFHFASGNFTLKPSHSVQDSVALSCNVCDLCLASEIIKTLKNPPVFKRGLTISLLWEKGSQMQIGTSSKLEQPQ